MPVPPNPDPLNIKEVSSKKIEVSPCGNVPPSGTIVTLAKAAYSDGQGFSIRDGSAGHDFVKFYIQKTGVTPTPLLKGYPIDISTVSAAKDVGVAIAAAVNKANAAGDLYLEANAEPTDGRVYLTYDFASDLASNGNDVEVQDDNMPAGSISPWIPGQSNNDVQNVQWAIEKVDVEGTIVLRQHAANTFMPSPFHFGRIGRLKVEKSVALEGQCELRAGFNDIGSGGWVLAGTTVLGGTQMDIGKGKTVTYSLKDIIFDGFYAGAVRVNKSKDGKVLKNSTISGCHFRNFFRGRVVRGTIVGAFPIVVDGGLTAKEADECGGTLKILNNYFGRPVAGTDPVTPDDNFNNLMHFSNCNLDLEISANEIEDCVWGGFMVFGNKGLSKITNNTITKTKSYLEGAAIGVGLMTENYNSQEVYTGKSEVVHNRITVSSSNSAAIAIAAYPRDLQTKDAGKTPPLHQVDRNVIVVNGAKGALACRGDCAKSKWTLNTVSGTATVGIWINRSLPPFPMAQLPDGDTLLPSNNVFDKSDLRTFIASFAQVFVDDAQSNRFEDNNYGPVGFLDVAATQRGLAGVYVGNSQENTFKRETFLGDYPGIMDSAKNPLSDPLPCVWLAGDAISNHVSLLHHDSAKPLGSEICRLVYCVVPANNNVKDYQQCCPVPASVAQAMAAKEQVALVFGP
jgi:hypothetical protein